MSDLALNVFKCPHELWHSHNSFKHPDGTVTPDPDGLCHGGTVEVNGHFWHVSHALALFLKQVEAKLEGVPK